MKNWITFAIVIIINEYCNDIITTEKRNRIRAAMISIIWNELFF